MLTVIGGSGGDSTVACENTAAATSAGLAAGMNSVELDISMSKDQVVFLWNDPNPLDPEAIGRSQEICVIYFFTETVFRSSIYTYMLRLCKRISWRHFFGSSNFKTN